jgi:aryl-alcohol dehydrogenase-like predicted oxidoreductase
VEYRTLGRSGLKFSALTMGTMTFGGQGDFANVGSTGVEEARRQVDICIDAGVNIVDTADVYSGAWPRRYSGRHSGDAAADQRERLDKVSAPPLICPHWHQAKTASDRLSPADLTLLGSHL